MVIKTKYNIGQKVWFLNGITPIKAEITKIQISEYWIAYELISNFNSWFVFENEISSTKSGLNDIKI